MAPLRSSRSTRNQDHQATGRNRPGVVDLDPTEGLPVQKWDRSKVLVNQDLSNEPSAISNFPAGTTTTSSAEWAAQFNTPQFPWPEKPLPSFFSQLTPWNQELVRRARTGLTNVKTSEWDNKTSSWISAAEAEKRSNPLKSVHLNNLHQTNGSKQEGAGGSPVHDDEDDHDDKSDDEADADNADDDAGPAAKKPRKYAPEERTFEVRQWKQVPSVVSDKTEERKFLADRRPGMPSLYGGAYQNQVFGSMGLNTNGYGFSAANAGYDLGDGGGLGNAGVVLGANEEAVAPVRKNVPPRRKKKKGGPGRKKANPNPVAQTDANANLGAATGEQALTGDAESKLTGDVSMVDGDNEVSESGSDEEGSEEGEIDEGDQDHKKQIEAVGEEVKVADKIQSEPHMSTVREEQMPNNLEDGNTNEVNTGEAEGQRNADNNQAEHQISAALQDTIMHEVPVATEDQPVADMPPVEPLEPEVIPSILQPPPQSEQALDVPLSLDPVQVQQPLPISEMQSAIPSEPRPDLQLPSQPEQSPQPQQGLSTEQIVDVDLPTPDKIIEEATAIPGLDPVPVEPTTQLPPITTAVAEAMDQPTISAPGDTDSTTTTTSAAVAASIPEPTSPDLLGGLEDALNKNMDEQSGD